MCIRDSLYYEDHTNLDNRFLRNRIRNELVPFLSSRFGPRIPDVLIRDQELLSSASQLIDELLEPYIHSAVYTKDRVTFSWEDLKEYSDAFLSELFVRACKRWRGHPYGIEAGKLTRAIEKIAVGRSLRSTLPAGPMVLSRIRSMRFYVSETGASVRSREGGLWVRRGSLGKPRSPF